MAATFDNIYCETITARGAVGSRYGAPIATLDQALSSDVIHPIDLRTVRVWDSASLALLPQTSASDDLGLYVGAFTSASWIIKTFDVKTLTTSLYGRFSAFVPERFPAANGAFKIRFYAGMITTIAGTSCEIDLVAYKIDRLAGISADLVTTLPITINTLGSAAKDFTLTATSLSPGDELDCRVAISVVDAATATAVVASIGAIQVVCTLQG